MKKSIFLYLCAVTTALNPTLFAQTPLNGSASRAVGVPFLIPKSTNPNVADGREFISPASLAIDNSSAPPALYVADRGNNRVMAWRNASTFTNGQKADFIIGQLDQYTTTALGPGTSRSTGLNSPIAVVVDSKGSLYVADGGNNRILRYAKPTANNDEVKQPNMVIGQLSFNSNGANTGGVSEKTLAFFAGGNLARTGMTFDKDGNLWVSDTLNNRVLRYPVSALNAGTNSPAADVVLGQFDFATNTTPPFNDAGQFNASRINKTVLLQPSGLAFDPTGRLYVCDSLARCVVYQGQLVTGAAATRIMGINVQTATVNPQYTEYTLIGPEGILLIGNNPVVFDAALNRILRYDAFETWAPETPLPPNPAPPGYQYILSPAAKQVIGQADFISVRSNRGLGEAAENTLSFPLGGALNGTEMFVLDSQNHRVLVFPTQGTGSGASRVLGQDNFGANAPNLLEGKEMFLYNGIGGGANVTGDFSDGGGIAVDFKASTPRLYVADTFNNRILGYKDARRVRPGDKADIVIGQADFSRSAINAPQPQPDGVPPIPTDVGLYHPSGLAVDANGSLWVCDSGNGRVLRYSRPFEQTGRLKPDVVIGQTGFFSKTTDATRNTMAFPTSAAFTVDGHLLVSDAIHNRVLLFKKPVGGDFSNGQNADRVIGQIDFNTGFRGTGANRFNSARGIATDTDDRLYVADAGNGRIVIYDRIVNGNNDPLPAQFIPGLGQAQGVYVSPVTGEIWAADTRNNRAVRFPRFDRLVTSTNPDYSVGANVPLAVTQDVFGNLFVAEGGYNRVAIFYNGLATTNAANGNDLRLSPGMIASIYPQAPNVPFGDQTIAAQSLPLPTVMGDIQVLVNDIPTPLFFVSPGQVNFLVPMSVGTSGTVEFQVVKQSLGQVLASGSATLDRVSPALFVTSGGAAGQVAALNDDNTVNSPTNMISRGKVITLFGTGAGLVTNGPPDGQAATGAVNTDVQPPTVRVLIGATGEFVPDANILYSGLAPGLPGVWQINVKIPDLVAPSPTTPVVIQVFSINSNQGKSGQRIVTTIAVKQ